MDRESEVSSCKLLPLEWISNEVLLNNTGNYIQYLFLFSFIYFLFLGPHLQHMKGPRLGVESEQQLWAYATAGATRDPSHICGNVRSLTH